MMEPVTFTGHITFEDAKRVEKLLTPRKWSKHGIVTIAISAVIGLVYVSTQTGILFTLLFFPCIGTMLGIIFWLANWAGIRASRRTYEAGRTEREVIIQPEKITVKTPVSSTDLKWAAFNKVLFAKDLVIVTDGKGYLAWAPYNFTTKEDWERSVALSKIKDGELQPSS